MSETPTDTTPRPSLSDHEVDLLWIDVSDGIGSAPAKSVMAANRLMVEMQRRAAELKNSEWQRAGTFIDQVLPFHPLPWRFEYEADPSPCKDCGDESCPYTAEPFIVDRTGQTIMSLKGIGDSQMDRLAFAELIVNAANSCAPPNSGAEQL